MDQEQRKAGLGQIARLQNEAAALAAVVKDLSAVPQRLALIDRTLGRAEADLDAAKRAVQDAGKERRGFEQDVEAIKVVISRYQGQLLEVKNNEQYRVLTLEIATQRSKIDGVEEKILLNMERTEGLTKLIATAEAALAVERKRVAAEKAEIEIERGRWEKEKSEREATVAELDSAIPKELLGLFRRIAQTRGGIGLSITKEGLCGHCRVRARPQALAEARAFERIVQCDNCQRILYVTELPPAVAPLAPDEDGVDA